MSKKPLKAGSFAVPRSKKPVKGSKSKTKASLPKSKTSLKAESTVKSTTTKAGSTAKSETAKKKTGAIAVSSAKKVAASKTPSKKAPQHDIRVMETVMPALPTIKPISGEKASGTKTDKSVISEPSPNPKRFQSSKYEIVRPKAFSSDTHDETWALDDLTPSTKRRVLVLRRWWQKQDELVRAAFLIGVVAVFLFLILLSLTMIGIGAYYMDPQNKKEKPVSWVDERLRTKTSACRAGVNLQSDKICMYEMRNYYGVCSTGYLCGMLKWEFKFNTTTRSGKIVDSRTEKHAVADNNLDFAECGFRKWCIKATCTPANVTKDRWWSTGEKTFRQFQRWEKTDSIPPCMRMKDGDSDSTNEWNRISSEYHDKCNSAACNLHPGVKFAMQIEYQRCVLDEHVVISGLRHIPCSKTIGPVNFIPCQTCPTYDESKESDLRKCEGGQKLIPIEENGCLFQCGNEYKLVPEGARCGKSKNGVCFMGYCQTQLKQTKNQSEQSDDDDDH